MKYVKYALCLFLCLVLVVALFPAHGRAAESTPEQVMRARAALALAPVQPCTCAADGFCICGDSCACPACPVHRHGEKAPGPDAYEVSLFDASGAAVVCTAKVTLPAGASWPQALNCCGKTFDLRYPNATHKGYWYGERVAAPAPRFFAPPPMMFGGGFGGGRRGGGC